MFCNFTRSSIDREYFPTVTFPSRLSLSCKNFVANTAATNTLNAPRGVTTEAGAKAYAAKFEASPIPTAQK